MAGDRTTTRRGIGPCETWSSTCWPEPSGDGWPEKHPRRELVNTILHLVRSGCPWRYLPADLPPWQTVYGYFVRWEDA